MVIGRRAWLLFMGFSGSLMAFALLIANCVSVQTAPVIAQISLSFPFAIENTDLIVNSVTGYEGPFFEDGSDEEVVDVAALIIHNTGSYMVTDAVITLKCKNEILSFEATDIPAGASLVVLEKNKKVWEGQEVLSCYGSTRLETNNEIMSNRIRILESNMGELKIENLTDNALKDITVYHKSWFEESFLYMGGITYETHIDILEPGQLLIVRPNHYAAGYSKVIKIEM